MVTSHLKGFDVLYATLFQGLRIKTVEKSSKHIATYLATFKLRLKSRLTKNFVILFNIERVMSLQVLISLFCSQLSVIHVSRYLQQDIFSIHVTCTITGIILYHALGIFTKCCCSSKVPTNSSVSLATLYELVPDY